MMRQLRGGLALTLGLVVFLGLGAPAGAESGAQIAVDPLGTAHLSWTHAGDTNDVIQQRTLGLQGALGDTDYISAAGRPASDAEIATDSDGNTYSVWVRSNGSNDIVQARRRDADGTLRPVQNLSSAGRDARDPDVAVTPAGDAVFTWGRSNGSDFIIQARRRAAATGALSPTQSLSAPEQSAETPQVAVESDGDAFFVWRRSDGSTQVAQARRRAADGTLGAVQNLSAPGVQAQTPRLVIDAAGNVQFVWRGDFAIQTRRRSAGGSLGAVVNLADGGSPQLGVGAAGDIYFTWIRYKDLKWFVQTRRRAASGTFGSTQDLSAGGSDPASVSICDVAVAADGDAYFTWAYGDDGPYSHRIQFRRKSGSTGTLSSTQDISDTDSANHQSPRIGLDPNENATFVWTKDGAVVQARRRASGGSMGQVLPISN